MFSQKIKTIENILNKFGTVIDIDKSKCVQLRSKRASCKDCISACPSSAINISNNEVDIDSEKCSECGICCKVCKTGVFKFKNLSEIKKPLDELPPIASFVVWLILSHHHLSSLKKENKQRLQKEKGKTMSNEERVAFTPQPEGRVSLPSD